MLTAFVVIAMAITAWMGWCAGRLWHRHQQVEQLKCPACFRPLLTMQGDGAEILIAHEPPECSWFTQKMHRVAIREGEIDG